MPEQRTVRLERRPRHVADGPLSVGDPGLARFPDADVHRFDPCPSGTARRCSNGRRSGHPPGRSGHRHPGRGRILSRSTWAGPATTSHSPSHQRDLDRLEHGIPPGSLLSRTVSVPTSAKGSIRTRRSPARQYTQRLPPGPPDREGRGHGSDTLCMRAPSAGAPEGYEDSVPSPWTGSANRERAVRLGDGFLLRTRRFGPAIDPGLDAHLPVADPSDHRRSCLRSSPSLSPQDPSRRHDQNLDADAPPGAVASERRQTYGHRPWSARRRHRRHQRGRAVGGTRCDARRHLLLPRGQEQHGPRRDWRQRAVATRRRAHRAPYRPGHRRQERGTTRPACAPATCGPRPLRRHRPPHRCSTFRLPRPARGRPRTGQGHPPRLLPDGAFRGAAMQRCPGWSSGPARTGRGRAPHRCRGTA